MSKTMSAPSFWNHLKAVLACASLCFVLAAGAHAQSTSIDQPTPITSNQIAGQITPRDIGDSRLTRHFYILTGTPGDLVLTVESRNLDGDVDLFQSGTLRPLAKVSMYAGELSTSTSKSLYLRQRETIILRVEARTPNDDRGDYRISFSGGFEAMAAPAVQPEADTVEQSPVTARRDKGTRRVNSVGARINEPEPVVTEKTTQPETPNDAATDSSAASNGTADGAETKTTTPAPVTTARTQRPPTSRANRRRRGRVTPTRPPETAAENSPATDSTGEPPPIVTRPTGIEAGAKLIIETRDGVRVERFMNTVRRVTVENGQIVVIMKDGKVARHPMTDVVRMSIEP
jgi:hypothetical protein